MLNTKIYYKQVLEEWLISKKKTIKTTTFYKYQSVIEKNINPILGNIIFNLIIVNINSITEINKQYRNIDNPTDVISFALEDDDTMKSPSEIRILGDIYICIEKVHQQAKEYGHSFKRELSFLAIHGLLHLLGYDHMNEEDEKVMFNKQDDILDSFGIHRD